MKEEHRFRYDPLSLLDYIEIFKSKMRIAVVYGGNKDEPGAVILPTLNSRPWKSYKAVAEDICHALSELGFRQVYTIPDDLQLLDQLKEARIDLAWLNTGGVQGYEPLTHTPAFLEMAGVPYVGHDPLTAGVLDNKLLFKQKLVALGLPTPRFVHWSPCYGKIGPDFPKFRDFLYTNGDKPLIVKPISGRASLYVEFVCSVAELPDAVYSVHEKTHYDVLIEEYLPGKEYCVSVCGPMLYKQGQLIRLKEPFAFSALERYLDKDEMIFPSMDKKAITLKRARLLNTPEDTKIRKELIHLGQLVYTEFNLSSIIRADLRSAGNGQLYFLECNPKPDLKRPEENVTSLATLGLEDEGLSYTDLIASLMADRLDYLFHYRSKSIQHLTALLV